jgi:hypothetical protein
MNYKDEFNEWASEFFEMMGRDPELYECEEFERDWLENSCELLEACK